MRFFSARRLALAALVPALLVVSVVPGCSNEGEGERCGDNLANPDDPGTTNDADCQDGLKCIAGASLISGQANRCCDPNPQIVHDSRCQRNTAPPTTDAGSDDAAAPGMAGASNGGSAGTAGASGNAAAGTSGSGGSTPIATAGAGGN